MISFCSRLLIVMCLAGLSLYPRSTNAAPRLMASTQSEQNATASIWISPWILGGVGATGLVGAVTVLALKRSTESGISSRSTTEATSKPELSAIASPSMPTLAPAIDQNSASSEALTQVADAPLRPAKLNRVEEFIGDLQSVDPACRRKAIWELGQRGDTRAVQSLVELLIDSDSKQRSLILSALSEIGTRTLKPMTRALAISLQDENAEVRKNAIRDLTRMYEMVSQISSLLHSAIEDSDSEVQETARWALGQLARIRSAPDQNLPWLKGSAEKDEK